MKKIKQLFGPLLIVLLLTSCIQDEPANAEADIVSCTIVDENGKPDDNIKGELLISNQMIRALAIPRINLKALAPHFEVTPGATTVPLSGTIRDFSKPQVYTVTSEDGKWHKEYTISIDTSEMPTIFEFEHTETKGKYEAYYEMVSSSGINGSYFKQYIWASGNPGFALTGMAKSPKEYPTASHPEGKRGEALRLVTKSTGSFGELVNMPIAAGNLFIGSFEVANAMSKPLEATLFGLPFGKKPLLFKGWYRYKGGAPFIIQGENGKKTEVPGRIDKGDIYAVLYESEGLKNGALNGADVLTSPNIVAMARVKNVEDVDIYQYFEIPFELLNGKTIEQEKLNNYQYNLAVVFTSSVRGAYFEGAIGSTLYVDDVEIVCEK